MSNFCKSLIAHIRRKTSEVKIGSVTIGGSNPVAPQSMTNTDTMDTAACVDQIGKIRNAGCRIVRLTAQGKREGENLGNIIESCKVAELGDVALVADVHFTADVAMIAAEYADKVRINPGNYSNTNGELLRLIEKCRKRGVALRIGVNHGSLAPHIVEQYGDTPAGMVESAMEYLRECRKARFNQIVVSMKSSNVRVMVYAYRLLVVAMERKGMHYPLHLGVTEAGDGDEGRVKSAVGIGALMTDGIGDTIRVSLTEAPQNEIPVANAIIEHFERLAEDSLSEDFIEPITDESLYSPYEYRRRNTVAVGNIGGDNTIALNTELDTRAMEGLECLEIAVLGAISANPAAEWRATILNMEASGDSRPVILHRRYEQGSIESLRIKASADFGMLFIDGLADGIWIENEGISQTELDELSLSILQATRVRMSKTEFIACPGCGRTLFDLQSTLGRIKERTSHLKTLKIGIMGCIVNGPGEMADADYGYVGESKGKITLYKGREVIRRGISESDALDALVELIKQNGDWKEPE